MEEEDMVWVILHFTSPICHREAPPGDHIPTHSVYLKQGFCRQTIPPFQNSILLVTHTQTPRVTLSSFP